MAFLIFFPICKKINNVRIWWWWWSFTRNVHIPKSYINYRLCMSVMYVCRLRKKNDMDFAIISIHSFIHSLYRDFFWLFIINQRKNQRKKCKISSPISLLLCIDTIIIIVLDWLPTFYLSSQFPPSTTTTTPQKTTYRK